MLRQAFAVKILNRLYKLLLNGIRLHRNLVKLQSYYNNL